MEKNMLPSLRPKQEHRQSYHLSYSERMIPAMLSMNACQLNDYLSRQAERNPCIELTFRREKHGNILEEVAAAPDTDFHQELLLQLPERGDRLVLRAARLLISQLEDTGYLPFDPVSAASGPQRPVMELALAMVQALDPAGVGACSLRECYRLQAERDPTRCADALALVSDEELFERYKERDFAGVCKVLQWTRSRLDAATEVLKTLSMHPLDIQRAPVEYIVPDAEIFRRTDGGYVVRLVEGSVPCVTLSESYLNSLRNGGGRFANEGVYYAKRLLYCLEHRNATLLGLLQYAVERQAAWLEGGARVRLPFSEVARVFSISRSTASRALQGKYVLLRGTVLPAVELFCRGGTRELSRDAACILLRRFLAQEPPGAPLSDQELSRRLYAECGALLSRRTIAKYRPALGVAAAARRKQ
ncbi:MAG: hypothetical protein VB071_05525 [Lawsonibacter sp.]|nr:hypothetical protein [Lawsonibacter sp.]